MRDDLVLIVMRGYQDRGENVNKHLCELMGVDKNFMIDFSNPRFSNGESKVVIEQTVRNKDVYIITDIGNHSCTYKIYNHENHMSPDEHYVDVTRVISAIGGKARRITIFMPLMYASRQHRRSGRESLDCAMALRHFEELGVSNVITFDLHDMEVQNTNPIGSIDSIMPLYAVLKEFIANEREHISKDKMVVISPDTGAMNRAKKYAGVLGLDIGLFYKQRDYTRIVNGKNPVIQHQYIGPDINGKSALIIDDMLSSGDSVLDVADKLKARGADKIYVITTFAFFTEGYDKFDDYHKKGYIEKVYSTNASYIPEDLRQKKWFFEIKVDNVVGDVIYALNQNKGLGEILDRKKEIQILTNSLKEQ